MTSCWVCGSPESKPYRRGSLPEQLDPSLVRLTDREFGQTAELFRCRACGFISTDVSSALALTRLYVEVVDEEYVASSEARRPSFRKLMGLVSERSRTGPLLDIGAGIGLLCEAAAEAGFLAEGIEPSLWAVSQARARGLTVHPGYFPDDLPVAARFEVITCVDVIEHVTEPVQFLAHAGRRLVSGGLLVIATPDIGSFTARLVGRRWWGLRPGHVAYFDRRTMDLALRRAGLVPLGSQTFGRSLPIGYLIVRVGDLLGIPRAARWLAGQGWLSWLYGRSLRLDLRDTRVYFATTASDPSHED